MTQHPDNDRKKLPDHNHPHLHHRRLSPSHHTKFGRIQMSVLGVTTVSTRCVLLVHRHHHSHHHQFVVKMALIVVAFIISILRDDIMIKLLTINNHGDVDHHHQYKSGLSQICKSRATLSCRICQEILSLSPKHLGNNDDDALYIYHC